MYAVPFISISCSMPVNSRIKRHFVTVSHHTLAEHFVELESLRVGRGRYNWLGRIRYWGSGAKPLIGGERVRGEASLKLKAL